MIRKFGGATGIDLQPQGLDVGLSSSPIKSIQTGLTSIQNVNSINVSISAVDLTKAIVIINNTDNNMAITSNHAVEAYLSTSTNIILRQADTTTSINYISWTVIEFNNLKSLQSGSYQITSISSEQVVTVSNINTNKSVLLATWFNTYGTSYVQNIRYRIINNTSIGLYTAVAQPSWIYWYLVEFN